MKKLESKIETFAKLLDKNNNMANTIRYMKYKERNYDTRDRNIYEKISRYSSGSRKN